MTAAKKPVVCVCVPTYNAAGTLSATLDSILAQTYTDIKVFIVDNASTDNTGEIAALYAQKDRRVRFFPTDVNTGAEGNFTRCVQSAEGDYTAIFHADDIYTPEMIAEEVLALESHREAGAVFTMAINIDAAGKEVKAHKFPHELRRKQDDLYGFGDIFKAMLKYGNFLFCPSAMARTVVYKEHVQKWDYENFSTAADSDVWLRILQKYPIRIINKPLLRYRVSPSSYSYNSSRAKTGAHPMFHLFDAYMAGYAREIISENDRKNYRLLVLKDNINRAFNLLITDKKEDALALLPGIFAPANISHALKSWTHIKVIASGYTVWLLSFISLNENLRKILFRARFGDY